ncbi:MAG: thioredoxin-disulfide reductase [Treponema sp.]|nr:thioredoxin-disulfide reductase [Treponema sp.]
MSETNQNDFDFISIGAGAAGLAAVQYAARSGLTALALDISMAGGQVLTIANLENYPGVFPGVNGFALIQTMQKQAQAFGAKITSAQVKSIDKVQNKFEIETSKGKYVAKALVLATGAEHRKLGVPGEKEFEGRGVSYCAVCDGPLFRNKSIFVIGGGDAACDEANYLSQLTDKVFLVHRREELRAQKAVADRVLENQKITVLWNSVVEEIKGEQKVTSVVIKNVKTGQTEEKSADAIFVSVGMLPRNELLSTLKTDQSGYIVTDEKMQTSIPGLYAAGDVRSKPFRQVVTATSDGAIAAFEAASYIRSLA